MSMRGVLRLAEVQMRVLDMADSKQHYGTRMGLHEMMTDDNGLVYFKAWAEHDHHSLVLRETDQAGLDHIAFKVYDDATLDDLEKKIIDFGIEVERVDAGVYPKSGRRLKFILPTGHEMHLFAEKEQVGNSLGTHNPDVIPDDDVCRGFRINGLDHVFIVGPDADQNLKLFTEVFDFNYTERVIDGEGNTVLFFVSCSSRAHDIAFGVNPNPGLIHHVSFRLENSQDHIRAADLIGKYEIPVEMNDRHGVTQVKTVYYFDPSGNRNEVFCDGYTYYPDMPLLTWTMDELGHAAFSQSLHVPESFFGVNT